MAKIKEFKEKERYTLNLLVKSVVKGVTQKGSPYLNLVLQDNTGTIDGKLWDASEADMANARPGHVEKLSFEVLDYNNALQLRVNRITDLDQDLVDLSEYVMTSPVEIEELKARINGYINSITNPTLKALVSGMHEKTGKKFYDYPAASRIHHNYLGGLAEHTLGMADLAETIAGQYPVINR
ncbi:MAG: 3'-5' exonuclease, partial [Solobacterium sp.]|nr:3'-5' exonuclease [Solobacterium sp.]